MKDKDRLTIETYLNVVTEVDGIDFIEFVKRDEITKQFVMAGTLIEKEVSTCNYPCKNIDGWITKILDEFKIQGEFLFLFENRRTLPHRFPDIPKVKLSATYEWVQPLWELGEYFMFMPLDKSYQLQILWEESTCLCVIAYRKDLPKVP